MSTNTLRQMSRSLANRAASKNAHHSDFEDFAAATRRLYMNLVLQQGLDADDIETLEHLFDSNDMQELYTTYRAR